jgi:hypothetical protein
MFDFIKTEVIESRMFRTPLSFERTSAHDLARILYVGLLTIELMRHDDESTARTYCAQTIKWGDFDHMRSATTDLGNIIVALSNQSDYEDRMNINLNISAPVLQIKTYLRGVWMMSFQHGRDRQFFMNLETALGISDSSLYQVRRTVLDWPTANASERHFAISNMRRELYRHATRLDLLEYMPKE